MRRMEYHKLDILLKKAQCTKFVLETLKFFKAFRCLTIIFFPARNTGMSHTVGALLSSYWDFLLLTRPIV